MCRLTLLVCLLALLGAGETAFAGDWPMWRYNATRGGATPGALPEDLTLHWVRELPPARPAWPPSQDKLQFDAAPEPVVAGRRIFVPSTVTDSVTAYDTATGAQQWRFTAGAPVRFAPVANAGRVYFVSDDGYLYCVSAESGELQWKVNGGPAERWVIGNQRLVSSWPARGGPVLQSGKIYFAASIWPFMGIFIRAVDAESGEVLWTNSGDGALWTAQPHGGAVAFATVAPQGHLLATAESLIVPGGRSTPAVFDAETGKLRHFQFDKRTGGHAVMATQNAYFLHGQMLAIANGQGLGAAQPAVIDGDTIISVTAGAVQAARFTGGQQSRETVDRRGAKVVQQKLAVRQAFKKKIEGQAPTDVVIKAGSRLYCGGAGKVAAIELGADDADDAKVVWTADVTGNVWTLLAADDRLFACGVDGKLYCFGVAAKAPGPCGDTSSIIGNCPMNPTNGRRASPKRSLCPAPIKVTPSLWESATAGLSRSC